ncbi:DsbA family oxidoreductase [Paenibacillus antri]|uniref:DsbA family oxidoreductase n=1 Tax=Paenibacillus antri TaxID=2582848 RepID=A0A5R9G658_9BACL|nr:DsbA family oxidoreductase [Paenibacillus antri]TLS49590.1 DsbA family oxidoreductase [Paenibacillus antri]
MKVEIWSDFVCPFCYIGKRRFEEALASLPFRDDVEVVYRSFELDPRMEKGVAYNVHEALAKKYGMSLEQARQSNAGLAAQAKQVGLDYNYDEWKFTNTFDAHRLAHFAASEGKAHEMTERLLHAYFTEAKHLGDRETLADLAADVGLNREAALEALASDAFADAVRADESDGSALGIRGVPFFVIDRKYGISGAQPTATFVGALQQAWDESRPSLTVLGGDAANGGEACADGACAVPNAKE